MISFEELANALIDEEHKLKSSDSTGVVASQTSVPTEGSEDPPHRDSVPLSVEEFPRFDFNIDEDMTGMLAHLEEYGFAVVKEVASLSEV